MAGWSQRDLEAAWVRNGGPRSTAALAAAIAGAESSFGANPYGDVGLGGSGPTSFGPWQIHTPAHPQYNSHLLVTNLDYSAKAAVEVSNGGRNFEPWTTFKTGAYRQFYGKGGQGGGFGANPIGEAAIQGAKNLAGAVKTAVGAGKTAVQAGETAGEVAGSVGGVFGIIKGWIDEPLTPVKFLGGTVLLYVGIRTLTGGTGASQEGSRAVRHAAELAAVIPK